MDTEYSRKVAKINDEFRRNRHGVTVTRGIQNLMGLPGLLDEIKKFSDFTQDNDPYG